MGVPSAASRSGKPFELVRRSDGLSLLLRSPLEIWIAMETCLERQYDEGARLPDDATVVDIGAGVILLYVAARAAERSTAAPSPAGGIPVPATTLDRLFEDHRIGRCDLLKIDCEGGEFEILFAAGPGTLARVRRICLEYRDGATAFRHGDLVRFLEERNFSVGLRPDPVHPTIGLLDAEARPRRPLRSPEEPRRG